MTAWPPYFRVRNVDHFLDTIDAAVRTSRDWERYDPADIGERCYLANYRGQAFDGEDLGLALACFHDRPSRVQLTMHAHRWPVDSSFPSGKEYAEAERLTLPLFDEAGRNLRRKLRLVRPKSDSPFPLRGSLKEAFERFTFIFVRGLPPLDKIASIHPFDELRFLAFVRKAHQHRSRLRPSDVAFHLKGAGFDGQLVGDLTRQYEVGRQILAMKWRPWN